MNELSPALQDAVRSAAAQVLGGNLSQLWSGLSEARKTTVYQAVIATLLGKDSETIADALAHALLDGQITDAEWKTVLTTWANAQAGGDEVARDLVTALAGGISVADVVSVSLKWAKRQVGNSPQGQQARALLEGVSATGFDAGAAWDAFKVYLNQVKFAGDPAAQQHWQAAAQKLTALVESSGKISKGQVFELLAAIAVATDQPGLSDILTQLRDKKPAVVLIAYLNSRLPAEAGGILDRLVAQDWSAVAGIVLGLLHLDLGKEIVAALAGGTLKDFASQKLTQYLTRQGAGGHAGDAAMTIIALVTGARSLFANAPEEDSPILSTPARVALWREIRQVIYGCQLFLNGGSVVSTDPTGIPHIFQAAAIRITTPVHELIPAGSSDAVKGNFADTLSFFLDAHFNTRLQRKFSDPPPIRAVSLLDLGATSHVACSTLYLQLNDSLKQPVS